MGEPREEQPWDVCQCAWIRAQHCATPPHRCSCALCGCEAFTPHAIYTQPVDYLGPEPLSNWEEGQKRQVTERMKDHLWDGRKWILKVAP